MKASSEFLRELEASSTASSRQGAEDNDVVPAADVTDSTDTPLLPHGLQLTVAVRDAGNPPRTTTGRLTV